MRVLVVGAGVSGLSCAVELLEAGAQVQVVTAAAPMGTVSAIAGAMLGPMIPTGGPADAWEPVSDKRFRALAKDQASGVRLIRGRLLSAPEAPPGTPPWAEAIPGYRPCEGADLPQGYADGFWVELPFAEMPRYLPWLVERVRELGATVCQEIVDDLAEAGRAHRADVVVNAAGLGAARLAGDDSMQPVWGQHVLVHAPSVETFVYEGGGTCDGVGITPHRRGVQLGSVRRPGRNDLAPDLDLAKEMVARCARVMPELVNAPVLGVEVGLRPGRSQVRLEREVVEGVPVVHDYGHAGSGVFWSWGCADQVAELVGA